MLIYFSPVAWDSYEQRPHYVVRDFLASAGDRAIWVNPYRARLPRLSDLARADLRHAPLVLERPAGLTVIEAGGLPVDPLPGGARINTRFFWTRLLDQLVAQATAGDTVLGIGRPTSLALAALTRVPFRESFYDAMDDFPEFYRGRSRDATRRVERDIAARVTRIFVSSTALAVKFAAAGPPVTMLRNAYDMRLLPAVAAPRPADPSLGFIGTMGLWFDWDLVARLAEAVRPMRIDLVGPRPTRPRRRLPDNVSVHPPCSQAESVGWLARFGAGLIPFTRTTLTAGIDPIKFYQYRAAGLPVLSTRFGEMADRTAADGVYFLDDAGGISTAVESALASQPDAAAIAAFREEHSWTARFRASQIWSRA